MVLLLKLNKMGMKLYAFLNAVFRSTL